MNPERAQAYRRVLDTLDQVGPSKLWREEQERIRYAADTLIFSGHLSEDPAAQHALEDAGQLCRSLVESGRWEQATATRLTTDLGACGPEPEVELSPA